MLRSLHRDSGLMSLIIYHQIIYPLSVTLLENRFADAKKVLKFLSKLDNNLVGKKWSFKFVKPKNVIEKHVGNFV